MRLYNKYLLIGLLLFMSTSLFAQQLKKVDNIKLVKVLTFIEEMKSFNNDELATNVYRVRFPDDIIPKSGSDEVFDRLYITISESGDPPIKFKVYEYGPAYAIENIELTEENKFNARLKFTYGFHDQKKVALYNISVKKISITKINK